MCTKSKQKRTGARGTHAGFPNVMMKQAGRTLTSRAGWLVSNFARLAFETSKIRSLDRTDENSRERTRERSGGRRSRIEGTGNCAAQLSAYHGVARLIKVCCYAVVNLAEGGERREGGRETTLVNPAGTFCSIGKLNVVPGALYFAVLLHLTDY